jgi:hypothetical protein
VSEKQLLDPGFDVKQYSIERIEIPLHPDMGFFVQSGWGGSFEHFSHPILTAAERLGLEVTHGPP